MRADLFQLGRRVLGLLLAPYGRPTSPDPKGAILYTSPSTRRVRALCPDGTDVALSGTGGSGTMNHAALTSNLAWGTSGHTGTASRLAGFSGAGATTYYQIGVDVQAYDAQLAALAGSTPTAGGITVWSAVAACADLPIGASGTILTSSGSAPQWTAASISAPWARINYELYGNGRDGNLVFDGASSVTIDGTSIAPVAGVYTLAGRDVLADSATLSDTVRIILGGGVFRCLSLVGPASGTAYIEDNGNDSSGGSVAGGALSAVGSTNRSSPAGGAGRGTAGVGTAGNNSARAVGGAGGAGGAAAGGSPAGGNGGTATTAVANGSPEAGTGFTMGIPPAPVGAGYTGGGGGGAGGCDGVSGVSGGGGGGGGLALVFVRTLGANAANVTIRANGGAAGSATGTDNGGGGGGGGGRAVLVYDFGTSIPTVQANGGTKGTGTGGGANGSDGSAGVARTFKATA